MSGGWEQEGGVAGERRGGGGGRGRGRGGGVGGGRVVRVGVGVENVLNELIHTYIHS